jgi:hypothetical protein
MSSLPGWAQWSIFVAAALLSPALAFLAAIVVAAALGALRDAGLLLPLAIVVGCTIAYWRVRRLRAARVAPIQF